ncbi:N-acetyl-D-Glu racemase DgcA [Nisaea sp.]|uniref:N-acetyl-D-Glu racemase DgcA n=1 Tax=Nisaea sp. TaxID=2024842 RepID=UPI00326708DB
MYRSVTVRRESWPLQSVFRISRGARTESEVVVVEIAGDDVAGMGECFPYKRYGETLDSVAAQIESVAGELANGMDRAGLAVALAPGAARNAIDCALWDIEAKQTGKRVWELASLPEPKPVTTVFTLGVDDPEVMGAKAAENAARPVLKLKMTGDEKDLERVALIHKNAPNAKLVVDANEGWSVAQYQEYAPKFAALGVTMIEQPLPAGDDEGLKGLNRVVPVCADESCHDSKTLDALAGKYDMINIKLDKTGGLTEALLLRDRALEMGFEVMVGCMVGTSLAMAPGVLVAQGCAVVDLDGPLLLAKDREPGLSYQGSIIQPPEFGTWG